MLRLVMWGGLTLAIVGILIGIAAALALARLMQALMFHVEATDPLTLAP